MNIVISIIYHVLVSLGKYS